MREGLELRLMVDTKDCFDDRHHVLVVAKKGEGSTFVSHYFSERLNYQDLKTLHTFLTNSECVSARIPGLNMSMCENDDIHVEGENLSFRFNPRVYEKLIPGIVHLLNLEAEKHFAENSGSDHTPPSEPWLVK